MLKPDWQVLPYPLDNPTPGSIQVMGITGVEYQSFGPGGSPFFTWEIEAAISLANDIGASLQLWTLMDGGAFDVKAALEDDKRLTSRLLDDQTIEISQEPACDDLEAVYSGFSRGALPSGGGPVLLATWDVRVLT